MSHTPHELTEEFSEEAQALHELRLSDPHFVELSNNYHQVNQQIFKIEAEIEPASDEVLTDLRKKRVHLKDDIAAMLAAKKRAVA